MTVLRIPIIDRASWLKIRLNDITASDIAATTGMHPYKSALRLWFEKTGQGGEIEETRAMWRGRLFESACVAAVREEHPDWTIRQPNVYLRDPEARIGATPDAIAQTPDGEVIIQCKVVNKPSFDRTWQDGPPIHYQLQTLTEAMLWGAPRAVLAALVIDTYGAELVMFDVARHPAAEAKIREHVAQFWADVAAGRVPAADYERDLELLQALHPPRETVPPLDWSTDNRIRELLENRERLLLTKIEADKWLDAIKAEIVDKLQGATGAHLPGWDITHKTQSRKAYEVKASTFQVLKITKEKDA